MNTVSEEQVLFNKLGYEEQQFILKQMRLLLQPCESICEEDNKEIKEILGYIDQFVYVNQSYNDIKLSKIDSTEWESKYYDMLDNFHNANEENIKLKSMNKSLSPENHYYKSILDKIKEILGNYKHYSTPDEKQNAENEEIVDTVYELLEEIE